MRRRLRLGLLLAAAAVCGAPTGGVGQAQGPLIVAFDMDTAGNSCPGTGNAGGTDCTLGPIDQSVQVTAGATIDFDVITKDIPGGENFSGSDYYAGRPAGLLFNITRPDPVTGLWETTVGVNLIADDPGSGPFFGKSDAVPNAVSPHHAATADYGQQETSPPFTQGVVHRFRATVGASTPAGSYGLFFDQSGAGGPVIMGNKYGQDMCVLYGCTLLDGNSGYGLIAVDRPCPVGGPVGGIAELPHVSGSSGSNYLALAALAAVGLLALTAAGWYGTRRSGLAPPSSRR